LRPRLSRTALEVEAALDTMPEFPDSPDLPRKPCRELRKEPIALVPETSRNNEFAPHSDIILYTTMYSCAEVKAVVYITASQEK